MVECLHSVYKALDSISSPNLKNEESKAHDSFLRVSFIKCSSQLQGESQVFSSKSSKGHG